MHTTGNVTKLCFLWLWWEDLGINSSAACNYWATTFPNLQTETSFKNLSHRDQILTALFVKGPKPDVFCLVVEQMCLVLISSLKNWDVRNVRKVRNEFGPNQCKLLISYLIDCNKILQNVLFLSLNHVITLFCHQKPSPFGCYRLEIHIHLSQRRGFSIESCCLESHVGQKLGPIKGQRPRTVWLNTFQSKGLWFEASFKKKTPPKHTWKRTEKLKTRVICRRDSTETGLPSSAAGSDVETFTERKPRSSKIKGACCCNLLLKFKTKHLPF